MKVTLLALVVLASLLIIASGVWVGVALVRALFPPPRPVSEAKPSRKEGQT
jgi:hypothetical protein